MSSGTRHSRIKRLAITAAAVGLGTVGTLAVTAQPAAAAWAYNLGPHTSCAQSLTLYNGGAIGTIGYGERLYIDHFADNGNHAWVIRDATGQYGWVYNGWFC